MVVTLASWRKANSNPTTPERHMRFLILFDRPAFLRHIPQTELRHDEMVEFAQTFLITGIESYSMYHTLRIYAMESAEEVFVMDIPF